MICVEIDRLCERCVRWREEMLANGLADHLRLVEGAFGERGVPHNGPFFGLHVLLKDGARPACSHMIINHRATARRLKQKAEGGGEETVGRRGTRDRTSTGSEWTRTGLLNAFISGSTLHAQASADAVLRSNVNAPCSILGTLQP